MPHWSSKVLQQQKVCATRRNNWRKRWQHSRQATTSWRCGKCRCAMSPPDQRSWHISVRRSCRDHDRRHWPQHQHPESWAMPLAVKPDRWPDRCWPISQRQPKQPLHRPRRRPQTRVGKRFNGCGCAPALKSYADASTSAIISISTQAPSGIWATPKALRAWAPLASNT